MRSNRKQVGALVAGLLVVLAAGGCSSSDDIIASGNVVTAFTTTTDPNSPPSAACISATFQNLAFKPAGGTCSMESGDFAGRPCGDGTDCSDVSATCVPGEDDLCEGGPDRGQPCDSNNPCADDPGQDPDDPIDDTTVECVPGFVCYDNGAPTGQLCLGDVDCDTGVCRGSCSGGPTPGSPCLTPGDCTPGECEGAEAADALEFSSIVQIQEDTPATFTSQCPRCELDTKSPKFCLDDSDCSNECVPAGSSGVPVNQCDDHCCEKFVDVPLPCTDDADCAPNRCVDVTEGLPPAVLSESRYKITGLLFFNLRVFFPIETSNLASCSDDFDVVENYREADLPLLFSVGENQSNNVRFVVDAAALESILGPAPSYDCAGAVERITEWFTVSD